MRDNQYDNLVKKIKDEMDKQHITQKKLAEKLGKSQATVSKFFNGMTAEITARDLGIICKLLKKHPDELMSWSGVSGITGDTTAVNYSDSDYQSLENKLRIKGYKTHVFKSTEDAVAYIVDNCKHKSVGLGSSIAFGVMGLTDALEKENIHYSFASETGRVRSDKRSEVEAINSTFFILPISGMSFDTADMVNISASGSKIAGSLYCAEEIIFVVGKNKIAENLEKAIVNHKNGYVAKLVELGAGGFDTPCAKTGKCEGDCNSPDKICRIVCTYKAPPFNVACTVIIVKEDIGY